MLISKFICLRPMEILSQIFDLTSGKRIKTEQGMGGHLSNKYVFFHSKCKKIPGVIK